MRHDENEIDDLARAELRAWAWYFGGCIALAALSFTVGYFYGVHCA